MVWWNKIQIDVERLRRNPITTWFSLKEVMKERFIPLSYSRDLHNNFQRLYQGSNSVEEYYQEMELALLRVEINEDQEATMSWVLHGLNREI